MQEWCQNPRQELRSSGKTMESAAAPIGKTCFGSYSDTLLKPGNFRHPACPGSTCRQNLEIAYGLMVHLLHFASFILIYFHFYSSSHCASGVVICKAALWPPSSQGGHSEAHASWYQPFTHLSPSLSLSLSLSLCLSLSLSLALSLSLSLSLCYRFQNTVDPSVATAKVNHPGRSMTDSCFNVSTLQRACA